MYLHGLRRCGWTFREEREGKSGFVWGETRTVFEASGEDVQRNKFPATWLEPARLIRQLLPWPSTASSREQCVQRAPPAACARMCCVLARTTCAALRGRRGDGPCQRAAPSPPQAHPQASQACTRSACTLSSIRPRPCRPHPCAYAQLPDAPSPMLQFSDPARAAAPRLPLNFLSSCAEDRSFCSPIQILTIGPHPTRGSLLQLQGAPARILVVHGQGCTAFRLPMRYACREHALSLPLDVYMPPAYVRPCLTISSSATI